jgi:hypothetical protein
MIFLPERRRRHNGQFVVEAAMPTVPTPTRMLITLSEGYHRLPSTKHYVLLCGSQPTTNPQRLLMRCDLNGWQRPPWYPTPNADTDNSPPVCWWIVVCNGSRSEAPWQPWEDGGCHGWWGTVKLALASFYQAKTHFTTHNNKPIIAQ